MRLFLQRGSHPSLKAGACAMELSAWLAGEPHSDNPQCVSPVLGVFMRAWNDALDDDKRQQLLPYCIRVIGTNTGRADDETRAWLATDWLVRVHTPAWLELAGLGTEAASLRNLPPLTSTEIALATMATIEQARWRAAAARDAARDAAGAAARDAARDAAWDAAWDAARAAAMAAAWAAAGAAARAAAGAAAWDALAPTVAQLQASAWSLLDRMIAVGAIETDLVETRVARYREACPA